MTIVQGEINKKMAIPGISLENDGLGLGAMYEAVLGRGEVEGCGKRPLLGKQAKNLFNECVRRNQEIQMQAVNASSTRSSQEEKKSILPTIAVLAVVGLILYLIFRR